MAWIKNSLNQPLNITVGKGKVISLLGGGSIELTEEELKFPQVQNLISRGALRKIEQKPEPEKEIAAPVKIKTEEKEKKTKPK